MEVILGLDLMGEQEGAMGGSVGRAVRAEDTAAKLLCSSGAKGSDKRCLHTSFSPSPETVGLGGGALLWGG